MKIRILVLLFIAVWSVAANAQDTQYLPTDSFLMDFDRFVCSVENIDWRQCPESERDSIRLVYSDYNNAYQLHYSSVMSNGQVRLYSEYKARYRKAIVLGETSKVKERVDSVGSSLNERINRTVSNGIGTLNGILRKKE